MAVRVFEKNPLAKVSLIVDKASTSGDLNCSFISFRYCLGE
jgi:hypothetical protein